MKTQKPSGRVACHPRAVFLMMLFLLLMGVTLGACIGMQPAIPVAQVQPDPARLPLALDSLCQTTEIPGISAAVILPDDTVWTGACGIAAPGFTLRTDHLFEIGSITKTYTAALVLDLIGKGQIDLDDLVVRLLPDIPHLDSVTVRHLLQHTSGLYDFTDNPAYLGAMQSDFARVWTARELLDTFGGQPQSVPGERWDYANTNYHLLGLVVEAITDSAFHHVLRERILDPHGLNHTYFGGAEAISEEAAHAFLDINSDGIPEDLTALVPNTAFLTSAWASGALFSTAEDVARWIRRFASGQAVPASLRTDFTQWRARGDGMDYGLGLIRNPNGATVTLGHKGNSAGFSASAWHAPKENITIAVLTNVHQRDVTPLATALLETLIGGVTAQLQNALAHGGAEAVIATYATLKKKYPPAQFHHQQLNQLGYQLLGAHRVEEAIVLFELNVREYPGQPNPYDSLGDGYMASGRIAEARDAYARAVELAAPLNHPNLPTYRANLERAIRELKRNK